MLVERVLSPWWRRALVLGGIALALTIVTWWPILEIYPRGPWGDGEYFQHMIEAAKVSLVRYHEMPLWMAYDCGGAPMWDNPEGTIASPIVFLTTGLPSMVTKIVWYLSHVSAGFVCMWLFARHEFALSRAASLVASCMWAFAVSHSSQYAGGHDSLVAFLYAPLALLLWRRAENDLRMAVGLGLLVGWMFYDGATYPLPHTALLLGAESLTRAWPAPRVAKMARAAGVVLVVGFCFGAPRLLPIADQFAQHHRVMEPDFDDLLRWTTLRDMYFAKQHSWGVEGQQYVWGEYLAYVGPVGMTLAAIGLFLSGRKNVWFFAVGAAMFALMLGHFSKYAPWSILQGHVYPFTSMRVPARFRLFVAGFIAIWIAIAVDEVPKRIGRTLGKDAMKGARVLIVGFALIAAGDVMGNASDVIRSKFGNTAAQPVSASTHLYYEGPGLAAYVDQPRQNRGRVACVEHWIFTAGAPVWSGDVPQARAADDSAIVEVANRTQNTFTIDVTATRPSRVRVNSGYDHGWRTDVGTTAEENKLLVVDIPAGHHRIHLKYWPHGLTLGFFLAVLALAGSLAYLFKEKLEARLPWSRRRRDVT